MGDDHLRAVGLEIRRLRVAAGLSGAELARRAGVPQPTVSRVETGRRVSDAEVVVGLLAVFGLDAAESDRLARLVRGAYAQTAARRVDAGVSFRPAAHLELARSAVTVRSFEALVIPRLLRTDAYAEAAKLGPAASAAERSAILSATGRAFTFVLTEAALRTWPGSGNCMPEQLAHLRDVAVESGARLGVIPASAPMASSRCEVPLHGFTLYDGSAVTVETFSRELTLTDEADVGVYIDVFEGFSGAAVFGEVAGELIDVARRDYLKLQRSIH